MKNLLLLVILLQISFSSNIISQTIWDKEENNPVLEPGPTGSWDDESTDLGSVLFDGAFYHMWYSGFDGVYYRIGHATSPDGISWTKDPLNPVLDVGPAGSWEESLVYIPTVILKDGVFHMWYDGAWGWTEKVGHATSSDGSIWTKDPNNPVLDVGAPGSWDDVQVFPMAGSVIYDGGMFKMWFGGGNSSNVWQIGYATSNDGSVWTKDNANNPVMSPGGTGEWDSYSVIPGTVRWDGSQYCIWYSGCKIDNRWRVGYATSPDGISWAKYSCNPILDYGNAGSWDFQQAWNGSVIFDSISNSFKMWYTGGPYNEGCMGLATSNHSHIIRVPCDYTTIQEGIDAATNGDTVLVADGIYLENINFKGKAITVASHFIMDGNTNHINNTTIDGSMALHPDSAAVVTFNSGEDTTSILSGFSITGGFGNHGELFGYSLQFGGGVSIWDCGAKIIHNKIFSNYTSNVAMSAGGGIGCFVDLSEKWVVIEDNTITENIAYATDFWAYGGGIYVGTNCRIRNNIVENNMATNDVGNADGGGIETETYTGSINTCIVSDNTIQYNSVEGAGASGGGFCSSSSNVTLSNNLIRYNTVTGTECWGGGIDILDLVSKLPHIIIQNNTISDNEMTGIEKANGGGIRAVAVSIEISDNIIKNNNVTLNDKYWGAGVMVTTPINSVIITNNEFSNNTGDVYTSTGAGGGLALNNAWDVPVEVDGNLFLDNVAKHGAGLYFKNCYRIMVSNNLFSGDSALLGGGIGVFQAVSGPGLYAPLIVNNTFFNNHANETGGALRLTGDEGSGLVTFNNIFWENDADIDGNDIFNNSSVGIINVHYSDIDTSQIAGFWTGDDNFYQDPMFEEDDTLCHIYGGPCHNAGINELEVGGITYYAPDVDYEGTPRPQGAEWDIGADECLMIGIGNNFAETSLFDLKTNPNPSSGILNISYKIEENSSVNLSLINMQGELLDVFVPQEQTLGNHSQRLNISHLSDGLYLVRLQVGGKVEIAKIILMKK